MTVVAVFPGQGSQSVAMLTELDLHFNNIKHTFTEASEILHYDLWALVQQGPEAQLNITECTQPALLTAGVAVWRVWRAQGGPQPAYMAGHSLGEYTALVCAGALDFTTAVKLVEFRGQAMQQAVPAGTGAMAAILGLEDQAVRDACSEAAQGQVVEVANFNAPGQVVIAGHKAAVERAMQACKARGAVRNLLLPVSVPSHCTLMKSAAQRLSARLAKTAIGRPAIPVIHNVDVASHAEGREIGVALETQLYKPVRWVETIRYLEGKGINKLVELGPGKVLAGLNKRISKTMPAYAVYNPAGLEAALRAVSQHEPAQ